MPDAFSVRSHRFNYEVKFMERVTDSLRELASVDHPFFVCDRNVFEAHKEALGPVLSKHPHWFLNATEENKSLEKFPAMIQEFGKLGVKRNHTLVAIGGGITQDVTCFLAANMFRGMSWMFFPTTLLAQADSCIGSKSSINVGDWKNILGTFTPPLRVYIAAEFLDSLERDDVLSGIGEMIKVHIIDGYDSFRVLQDNYEMLFASKVSMLTFIERSLKIKKTIIELDEFDRGPRNVMNYGHSFGHAIEAATSFAVPHGIAVTIGMDIANYVAWQLGRVTEEQYRSYSELLEKNSDRYFKAEVPFEPFFSALQKDKKNISGEIRLILLNSKLKTEIVGIQDIAKLAEVCHSYFASKNQSA